MSATFLLLLLAQDSLTVTTSDGTRELADPVFTLVAPDRATITADGGTNLVFNRDGSAWRAAQDAEHEVWSGSLGGTTRKLDGRLVVADGRMRGTLSGAWPTAAPAWFRIDIDLEAPKDAAPPPPPGANPLLLFMALGFVAAVIGVRIWLATCVWPESRALGMCIFLCVPLVDIVAFVAYWPETRRVFPFWLLVNAPAIAIQIVRLAVT